MEPTMTTSEAKARASSHMGAAQAALPKEISYELYDDEPHQCTNPTDGGSDQRVEIGESYWLNGTSGDLNQYFDAVKEHWTNNGWKVLADDRPKDPYLWVENPQDAFRMNLQARDDGRLNIGVVSPCIWPEGTPPPSVTE